MSIAIIVLMSETFSIWLEQQDAKTIELVKNRFSRIELYGHFGEKKYLGNKVHELKWKNGLRVYYSYSTKHHILALIGGTKHGQQKDTKKAKAIIGD